MMVEQKIEVLKSKLDASVNFIRPNGQESRYVRRSDDYFIAYLSSHNGCNKACRFCHLTQTGQTSMVPSTFEDIKHQLQVVLKHYEDELALGRPAVKKVHINFMARGEPLESPLFHGRSWLFLATYLLSVLAYTPLFKNKVEVKFNISTIIPNALTLADLPNTFEANLWPAPVETRVYYSLYSMDQEFRKRWMPKAKNPYLALEMLAEWQARTKGQVVLHWAMIENENDSLDCIDRIVEAVRASGLKAKFNLVRYNPFSSNQGQESSEDIINARFKDLSEAMLVPGSRIVPKVGPDVYASCGMFLNRGQHA